MTDINFIDVNVTEVKQLPSFPDILKQILSTTTFQNNYSIKLDSELISILNKILSTNPAYFNNIQESFNSIIADQKIDINDIPAIISLLSNLYKILYSHNVKDIVNGISIDKCSIILKFVIDVIIKDSMVENEKQTAIISIVNTLIDTCAELIIIRDSLKTPTSFTFLPFCK
jgi:hypothetical protein